MPYDEAVKRRPGKLNTLRQKKAGWQSSKPLWLHSPMLCRSGKWEHEERPDANWLWEEGRRA